MTSIDRKNITFEQAEGVDPLPSQLQIKEISSQLRSQLWLVIYESLQENKKCYSMGRGSYLEEQWKTILYHKHCLKDNLMADDFKNNFDLQVANLKNIFNHGDYIQIFGFLEFVIRHPKSPYRFAAKINSALISAGAAYRIFEEHTIIPIASEADALTLKQAFSDLGSKEFNGARAHLRSAGQELTAGNYPDSIRESIHAVESVARVLAPTGSFSDALAQLEKTSGIHRGLKKGFNNIYGYTNDEKGLRHPLLDNAEAKVDEADALFMIGACASFVSYMVNKARLAGIIEKK